MDDDTSLHWLAGWLLQPADSVAATRHLNNCRAFHLLNKQQQHFAAPPSIVVLTTTSTSTL